MSAQLHQTAGSSPRARMSREEVDMADRVIEAIESADTFEPDDWTKTLLNHGGHDLAREKVPRRTQWMLPALDLPGFGDRYQDCGAEIPHVCEGCGHTVEIGRTCARSECPRCGSAWALKRAKGHVGRLHEAAKMMSSRADVDGAVFKHHCILSPPKDWFLDSESPLDDTFHIVRDILREIGAEGFVYYHPWSGSDDHQDDRGAWKNRLFQDRDWEGDVREEIEARPHFHVIAVAPRWPGGDITTAINEATGWVNHRITERNGSNKSLGDLSAVARAVTYCLSHTGIDSRGDGNNRAAMRGYGTALHDCLPLDSSTEESAAKAVHDAAPHTLGLATGAIECRAELPEEEAASLDEFEGDGEGDDSDATDESPGMVPCGRGLSDIDDAEFIDEPSWRSTAKFADEAVEAREAWEEANGWEGWIERKQQDTPPD